MKSELWTQGNVLGTRIDIPLLVNNPLTESDILFLQDAFLTNGFHSIKVRDIAAGRCLMQTFLQSLRITDVACLTMAAMPLEDNVTDIYEQLLQEGHSDKKNSIEEFLLNDGYFNFIWIEATQELENKNWHMLFQESIIACNLDRHMPIIELSYDE
ncbi:MAG: hypothetical protein NTX86_01655 [Candidatus Dependentiae bacterium]|nr:hypothetical protein [Candidatus Dependentiae bacterium]